MIDTYKIVTGIYDVDKETFFKPARELGTGGHCHKLYKQHAGSFLKHKSFGNRIVNEWNKFPRHVIEATDVNMFKNLLDEHWFNRKFDTPF